MDSGDLLFFIGFTAFLLFFCYQLLHDFLGVQTRWWVPAVIVGVVILGVTLLSGWWFWRVDFTADQRYSLAPVSQTVLEEIDAAYPGEAVEVTVLLDGPMLSDFQLLRTEVEALLYDMKSVMRRIQGGESRAKNSRSGFHFHFVNPLSGDRRITDQWAPFLESPRLSPYQVHSRSRPLIAFTEGHGELDDLELHDGMYSIARDRDVGRIDLQTVELSTLEEVDVMAVMRGVVDPVKLNLCPGHCIRY